MYTGAKISDQEWQAGGVEYVYPKITIYSIFLSFPSLLPVTIAKMTFYL